VDGQILASSLVSLKGTDLRMIYALLCKTNIGHLLSSKTKDLFSKEEQNHFTKHLEEEVNRLKNIDDSILQLDLFLELTKLLNLQGTKYTLQKEIEDQCTTIVNEVYKQYQKQDKHFRLFSENQPNTTKLQQMVIYQMRKVFTELDASFQDFSIGDQIKFASQVNDYIHSLPEDKQVKIKERLGVDDLTDELVRKAIATSGTSIVFAIIVEVSGFAFYTTATSLMATFAGLLGLTLPFGFYTGLTSTIAVLSNPLFIIPLLLGGGAVLVNHQNKSLKKKLLPIIVMQITLPFMSKEDEFISFNNIIQEWEIRYNQYHNLHSELEEILLKQKDNKNDIIQCERRIKECNKQIAVQIGQIQYEKQQILTTLKCSNMNSLAISSIFNTYKNQYQTIIVKIRDLENSKRSNPVKPGFFKLLQRKIINVGTFLDINDENKKIEGILEKMVTEVLRSTSSFKQTEREKVKQMENNIAKLTAERNTTETNKRKLHEVSSNLNQEHRAYTQKIKLFEKENYGVHVLITK